MVHMPSLEIWEWGLKIFGSALTLTTHVDHLLLYHTTTNMHKLRAQTFITTPVTVPHSTGKMIKNKHAVVNSKTIYPRSTWQTAVQLVLCKLHV